MHRLGSHKPNQYQKGTPTVQKPLKVFHPVRLHGTKDHAAIQRRYHIYKVVLLEAISFNVRNIVAEFRSPKKFTLSVL